MCTNTCRGSDLHEQFIKELNSELKATSDEKLEILWSESGEFNISGINGKDVYVGVTSGRIFKIEKGGVDHALISELQSASHQKNGVFRWDKVEVKFKNGNKDTFGIKQASACEYFVNFLNRKLRK